MVTYKILFSKRRSVSLQIDHSGNVIVRAPLRYSESRIQQLVSEKQVWIEKHLEKFKRVKTKQFTEGELFLYLGKEYPLRLLEGYRSKLVFENGFYISKHQWHKAKKLFEEFYRKSAKEVLLERANVYAQTMGVSFKKLNITGAGTRWGSCSSSGSINFSWRLILAPLEIVDYVVVHELAHIIHKNHSPRFWDLVGVYCKDYKTAKRWLRSQGETLVL